MLTGFYSVTSCIVFGNIKIHLHFLSFHVVAMAQVIDLIHKSQNAPVPYPTMLHLEQKCAHFCSEWSILGYGRGAFWDLWNWTIEIIVFILYRQYNGFSWPDGSEAHMVMITLTKLSRNVITRKVYTRWWPFDWNNFDMLRFSSQFVIYDLRRCFIYGYHFIPRFIVSHYTLHIFTNLAHYAKN